MNNYGDIMGEMKDSINSEISKMKEDVNKMIVKEQDKVKEMKEDRNLIGRDLYYLPAYIDENSDYRKGIIATSNGTYYRSKRDLPPGLESMAINAKYSEMPAGALSTRFRSIYLIVPSDESIEEEFGNQSEYIIEDMDSVEELMRYLNFKGWDVTLDGEKIIFADNAMMINADIQEFMNHKRKEEVRNQIRDEEEDPYSLLISGDMEI